MRDDHDVATGFGLHDRLPDQRANVVAAQLLSSSARSAARQSPRLAAECDPFEHADSERLPPLLVCHLRRVNPSSRRRLRDDLVVDVEESQTLGNEPADLLATGARCVRDADNSAGHVSTLGVSAVPVKRRRIQVTQRSWISPAVVRAVVGLPDA